MKSSELAGKSIAIAQVTFTGIKAFHMLRRDGVEVRMFFDRDCRLHKTDYEGTPIFPWANFYDTYVLLTIPKRYTELKTFLMEWCGYTEDKILTLDDIEFACTETDIRDELDWKWLNDNTAYAPENYISFRRCVCTAQSGFV